MEVRQKSKEVKDTGCWVMMKMKQRRVLAQMPSSLWGLPCPLHVNTLHPDATAFACPCVNQEANVLKWDK